MTTNMNIKRTLSLGLYLAISLLSAGALAAEPQSNPGGGLMPIHLENQKIGSDVGTHWLRQATSSAATVTTDPKPMWQRQTDSAYLAVFAHYCAPEMRERAAMAVEPNGIEVAIYTDRFRVEYGSNCRTFYRAELAKRIDQPIQQALIEALLP